jgi:hypothetical protein
MKPRLVLGIARVFLDQAEAHPGKHRQADPRQQDGLAFLRVFRETGVLTRN